MEVDTTTLIPIKFEKIMQSRTYTCIVLASEEKKFGVYTNLESGKSIQAHLTKVAPARPSTHQFIDHIFQGLEVSVKQIVINELQDTIYFARIFLEQKRGDLLHIVEIDARPSDSITLALTHKAPIFCMPQVHTNAIAMEDTAL